MAVAYVQAAQGAGTGTSLTVTLGTATTAGNCVLVMIYSDCSSVSQTVTGVTLGGSAGNFSQIAAESIPSNSLYTWAWADPSCAGGQTSIVVTTSQTSAYTLAAQLYEVSGVVAAGVLDLSAGASTTSGTVIGPAATGVTSLAWEFWCGFAAGVIGGATSFNGPASGGWTNEAVIKHTGPATLTSSCPGTRSPQRRARRPTRGTGSGTSARASGARWSSPCCRTCRSSCSQAASTTPGTRISRPALS